MADYLAPLDLDPNFLQHHDYGDKVVGGFYVPTDDKKYGLESPEAASFYVAGTFQLPTEYRVQPYMWNTYSHFGIDVEPRYLQLYKAAMRGDWESAENFIGEDRNAVAARISILAFTALHIASGQGHWKFVERLVSLMTPEQLELQDLGGSTALHYAAMAGSIKSVKAMLRKNRRLTQIVDNDNRLPLSYAASSSTTPEQKQVLRYLCLAAVDEGPYSLFASPPGFDLLHCVIASEYLDIATVLIRRYPYLAAPFPGGKFVLDLLVSMPYLFESQSRLGFWESIISHFVPVQLEDVSLQAQVDDIEQLNENFVNGDSMPFFSKLITTIKQAEAAANGIVEIVKACFEFFPDAIWLTGTGYDNLLETSIRFRQEKIFNLLQEITAHNKLMTTLDVGGGNTMLHVAAKLAPFDKLQSISGSALQMQSEIQWFKAVEKLLHPAYRSWRNIEGRTAHELFTIEHKELLASGEKWMKETSSSCMVVATLIATVVFAAAFTVPGGNNQDSGVPIFLPRTSFTIFAISVALALFSSTTSILMFLSILTSRFAEQDFLYALPRRMIIGLASLFLSIVTMLIAFGAALTVVLDHRFSWVAIPVTLLACVPVGLFAQLQVPLFYQMVKSTFWSSISSQDGNLYS